MAPSPSYSGGGGGVRGGTSGDRAFAKKRRTGMKNAKQAMQNAKQRITVLHFALPVFRLAFFRRRGGERTRFYAPHLTPALSPEYEGEGVVFALRQAF